MHVLIVGDLPEGPEDLEAMFEARGHLVRRVPPDEAEAAVEQRPPDLVVADPTRPFFDAVAELVRNGAASAALLVAVIDPASEVACRGAVGEGTDECLSLCAGPAYLTARLSLIERRFRKRSARTRIEQELAARVRQQAAIANLGSQVMDGRSLEEVAEFTVDAVIRTLEVDTCEVLIRPVGHRDVLIHAFQGLEPPADAVRLDADEETQAGFARFMARPIVVENLAEESRFNPAPHLVEHGVVSAITVSIGGEDVSYGLLEVGTTTRRAFNEDDLNVLQSLANMLASAAERLRTERAFRESEARARAMLETTVDGIITIDARGRIQSFNSAAEDIFGYAAAEVMGKNVKVLMPSPYHEEHDGYLQSYHETGRRHIIGIGREVVGRRKDGTTFPMDLAVSEIEYKDRVVFMGVIRDISDRRRLEQEILRISEQERRRIGQDLHDGLGQMLTGIGLITNNLARRLTARDDPAAPDVAEITEMIREADQHARGLARGLVPVDLEGAGLASALQRLAGNAERLFGIQCSFAEVGDVRLQDNTIATHLYRIAQEAVSNAVKHGRAQTVKISLAGGSDQLRLRIQDDGVGFPDVIEDETRGMGVHIMHYRARIIGANLEISDALDGGTTLTCTLRHLDRPVPIGGEEYGKVG
jgi:PAS domain S-box-containing protein